MMQLSRFRWQFTDTLSADLEYIHGFGIEFLCGGSEIVMRDERRNNNRERKLRNGIATVIPKYRR
jgi:hypothetical protein